MLFVVVGFAAVTLAAFAHRAWREHQRRVWFKRLNEVIWAATGR